MDIHTSCKFCGVPVVGKVGKDCPEVNVEAWRAMLCCNRCSDYMEWLRRVTVKVKNKCWEWAVRSPKKREETKGALYRDLEVMTQKIAQGVCHYHGVSYIWDADFIEQLMEYPDKAELIIKTYDTMVRRDKERERTMK